MQFNLFTSIQKSIHLPSSSGWSHTVNSNAIAELVSSKLLKSFIKYISLFFKSKLSDSRLDA